MPLRFQWVRPKPYPEHPTTLGEHLRRRRCAAGLRQSDVATLIGAEVDTYLNGELSRNTPVTIHYPAIFSFLGYDPFRVPATLGEQLASKRRELGLSIKKAAGRIGVDEGTFSRWERGLWKPRLSGSAIQRFIKMARD